MKNILIIGAVATLAVAGTALGSDIGSLTWNQSNIQTLRSFDKAAVVKYINEWGGMEGHPGATTEQEVRDFGWVDLAGDGNYQLALISSSGPCCVGLSLYWQDPLGKVTGQVFDGPGKLSNTVRDLNGDGRKELILWKRLAWNPGGWYPMAAEPRWPAVYTLKDGKYVEASRDFPNFYDSEILPQLDKRVAEVQQQENKRGGFGDALAMLAFEKNKILRVLGRDPTAGLQQAYQWMNSGDSQLVQAAIATFGDIGGHEAELRAAEQQLKPAIDREFAERRKR